MRSQPKFMESSWKTINTMNINSILKTEIRNNKVRNSRDKYNQRLKHYHTSINLHFRISKKMKLKCLLSSNQFECISHKWHIFCLSLFYIKLFLDNGLQIIFKAELSNLIDFLIII